MLLLPFENRIAIRSELVLGIFDICAAQFRCTADQCSLGNAIGSFSDVFCVTCDIAADALDAGFIQIVIVSDTGIIRKL